MIKSVLKLSSYKFLFFFNLLCYATFLLAEGFAAGTLVKTIDGYNAIENLKENDYVLSYDINNNTYTQSKIVKTLKRKTNQTVRIIIENAELEFDKQQKFFCPFAENCWVIPQDFNTNQYLFKQSSQLIPIQEIISTEKESSVYCLSLEGNHNFFVSKQEILVHNCAIPILGPIITWIATNIEITIGIGGILTAIGLNKITNKEARQKAKEWGYKEDKSPPFDSHGKPTFRKGDSWISPDRDGHNGGVWKEYKGKQRVGTLDANGNKIKG